MSAVLDTLGRGANRAHVGLYRRARGRRFATVKGLPVMLLTVAGRRTGALHTTPLVYLGNGNAMIVAGSAGGQKVEPQWFRNIRNAKTAQVEIGPDRIAVDVRVPDRREREELWGRVLDEAPFFAKYETKSGRQIPLAVLTPSR